MTLKLENFPDAMTLEEVAQVLRCQPSTIEDKVRQGEIHVLGSFKKPTLVSKYWLIDYLRTGSVKRASSLTTEKYEQSRSTPTKKGVRLCR